MKIKNAQNKLNPSQMLKNTSIFIEKVDELLEKLALDLTSFQLDHIALRFNDDSLAPAMERDWIKQGRLISKTPINGRPICIFKLDRALNLSCWYTYCVEFPYPKTDQSNRNEGWEHVEFVVPSIAQTADEYLRDIKSIFPKLADKWDELEANGVKVKLSSPKGEGERLNNPTIAFKWQGVCIKLHPHTLKTIIESEA